MLIVQGGMRGRHSFTFPHCTITNCYIFILTNLYDNYINPLYIYTYICIGYALLSH
jgi:hypothetical protein